MKPTREQLITMEKLTLEKLNKHNIEVGFKQGQLSQKEKDSEIIEGDKVQIARDWVTLALDYYEVTKSKKHFTLDEVYNICSKAFELVKQQIQGEKK